MGSTILLTSTSRSGNDARVGVGHSPFVSTAGSYLHYNNTSDVILSALSIPAPENDEAPTAGCSSVSTAKHVA
jgi:hypothetical protein